MLTVLDTHALIWLDRDASYHGLFRRTGRAALQLWIGRQIKAGRNFNDEQMNWLKAIKDYLAANVEIAPADLMRDQPFSGWGGMVTARKLFGAESNVKEKGVGDNTVTTEKYSYCHCIVVD